MPMTLDVDRSDDMEILDESQSDCNEMKMARKISNCDCVFSVIGPIISIAMDVLWYSVGEMMRRGGESEYLDW
jgi:hypothetical protein